MGLREYLSEALREAIDEAALSQCEALDVLLTKWGRAIGLTGFRKSEDRFRRYFLEPLLALPWVPVEGEALDVGSGGGSPALPLAIARRGLSWTLVESSERKAQFLAEAVRTLGLGSVRVECERFQEMEAGTDLELVTCRGVKLSEGEVESILACLGSGGRFVWFSSRERLREAKASMLSESVRVLSGPSPLLPDVVQSGWLLVFEKG